MPALPPLARLRGGDGVDPTRGKDQAMTRPILLSTAACSLLLVATGAAAAADVTEEELMQRLEGVAPPAVLENATLMHVTEDGEMQTVREGTNQWTCLYPGTDPMCADPGGMEWMHAYMTQGEAPQPLGFVYMLLGDEGASNVDPYSEGETEDNEWVVTGPHVMITGAEARSLLDGYPTEPDPSQPYVMWRGTPYEHLMIPTE
jgi:hypothetical protein